MSRNDAHLDAMLRHLGAAYYDSLHGRAAPADVARAWTPWPVNSARSSPCSHRPPGNLVRATSTISTMGGGTAGCETS